MPSVAAPGHLRSIREHWNRDPPTTVQKRGGKVFGNLEIPSQTCEMPDQIGKVMSSLICVSMAAPNVSDNATPSGTRHRDAECDDV
jgi:hypothetical protein